MVIFSIDFSMKPCVSFIIITLNAIQVISFKPLELITKCIQRIQYDAAKFWGNPANIDKVILAKTCLSSVLSVFFR